MATSGSIDFTATRDTLIKAAMQHVQYIGEGDTPTSTQYTEGAFLLNLITKARAYYNASALAVRITPNAQPADNTGRVRVTIHYYLVTAATS